MGEIGMFCLGAFVGSVIFYALASNTKWDSPVTIFNGAISAAVSGAILIFLQQLNPQNGELYLYPVGLAYGVLCVNLSWLKADWTGRWLIGVKVLHLLAFAFATGLLAYHMIPILLSLPVQHAQSVAS